MAPDFKTYIVECCRQAPLSWRKGAVIMTVLISLVLIGGLYLGWHFAVYPTSYFLIGTAVITAFDLVAILPYRLWKANNATIATLGVKIANLEERLSPKIGLFPTIPMSRQY